MSGPEEIRRSADAWREHMLAVRERDSVRAEVERLRRALMECEGCGATAAGGGCTSTCPTRGSSE